MIIQELRRIARDLRLADEPRLANKVLCALSAISESEEPNADLSYTYIMRQLRKQNDKAKKTTFQRKFKESFEAALDEDLEDPEQIALMDAIKAIQFEE